MVLHLFSSLDFGTESYGMQKNKYPSYGVRIEKKEGKLSYGQISRFTFLSNVNNVDFNFNIHI